jgi:hypothetical protein
MFKRPQLGITTRSGAGPSSDAMFKDILDKLCKMPKSDKVYDVTFFLKTNAYKDSVIVSMFDNSFVLDNGDCYTFTTAPTDESKTLLRDGCTYKFNVYTFDTLPVIDKKGGAREVQEKLERYYGIYIQYAIADQETTKDKLVDTKNFKFAAPVISFVQYLKRTNKDLYIYAISLCDFNCITTFLTLFQPSRYDKLFGESIKQWRKTVDFENLPATTYAEYMNTCCVEIPPIQFNSSVVITDFVSACAAYVVPGRTEDQVAPRVWFDIVRSLIASQWESGDMLSGNKYAQNYMTLYGSSVYSSTNMWAANMVDYIHIYINGTCFKYYAGICDTIKRCKSDDIKFPYKSLVPQ